MASSLEKGVTVEDVRCLFDYMYAPTNVVIKTSIGFEDVEVWDGEGVEIPDELCKFNVIYGDGINVEYETMYITIDMGDDDYLEYIGVYDDIDYDDDSMYGESVSRRTRRNARTPKLNLKRR